MKAAVNNHIWNEASKYNAHDKKHISEMFRILRGYTKIDKALLDIDQERLNNYIESIQ